MSDAGYTLAEMLAALAVIGMSIGGLTLGVQVLAPLQLSTSQVVSKLESSRSARLTLERWLAAGAPFSSQTPAALSGDANGFQFQCGAATPCTAQIVATGQASQLKLTAGGATPSSIVLPLTAAAHFEYGTSKAVGASWPPSDPAAQTLQSVTLVQTTQQGDTPTLEARIWSEEPAQCAFDPVMQVCQ